MYHHSKDKILSKIGYYNDQKGIINRYYREIKNWSDHLENTKKSILQGIEGKGRKKAVVLGSGWLLDVPIEDLSQLFNEVWLVDVYHPPQVVKKMAKYSNIRFIQTELTGLAEQIYDAARIFRKNKFKTPVDELKPTSVIDLSPYDCVISCNILSQLDIILTEYLQEYQIYTLFEIESIVRKIQNTHFCNLPAGKSVIICDLEELMLEDENKVYSKRPLIHIPLPIDKMKSSWIWKFDTQKTYNPTYKTYLKVASYYI